MFVINHCAKCLNSWEHYQQRHEVPPCPACGYPELKTSEEYYRAMGIKTDEVQ
jgi:hypothetical protein